MTKVDKAKNKFLQFADHFGGVVEQWDPDVDLYWSKPGVRDTFDAAAVAVLNKAMSSLPPELERFRRPNTLRVFR